MSGQRMWYVQANECQTGVVEAFAALVPKCAKAWLMFAVVGKHKEDAEKSC